MSRFRRKGLVVQSFTMAGGTATADVLLNGMSAPSTGAILLDVTFCVQIAGTVTTSGSYAFLIEKIGSATAVTDSVSGIDADAVAAGTIQANLKGLKAISHTKGDAFHCQVTETGTVATEVTYVVTARWLS